MTTTATLEEKFQAAVKAIQHLPPDGAFQPSNEMKLAFYGLYKQATVGSSKGDRPSVFNPVGRAKWDAWDKYRTLSKEEAMSNYIDEIRKILETMPQTNEVLELTRLIGPFYEFVDDQDERTRQISLLKKRSSLDENHHAQPMVNGFAKVAHDNQGTVITNGNLHTLTNSGNGPIPSSSPSSSSSSSSSSITSSDVEEYYEDPSDHLPNNLGLSNAEVVSDHDDEQRHPVIVTDQTQPGHAYGGQNGNNPHLQRSQAGHHHFNRSSVPSSVSHRSGSNLGRHSPSSIASGGTASGGDARHPNNNYNRETQRAILNALTKLQRDVNNILERLNRLETSTHFLQQRDRRISYESSHSNSISRWLPLTGLRRRAIAFILLWPFFVFGLIRLFLRARIIIKFRKTRL